LLILFSLVNRF